MTPTPQEHVVGDIPKDGERPLTGEEVVISGMSGIFPKSDSVLEFSKNLYDKVDMVSTEDPRWTFNHPEVPEHLGKVKGMGKFDAQFFRVHFKQACTMEPMSRKLLEHAYSAIYDSGINPLQLRGRKVGVFIGSTFSESEKTVIYETIQRNGFGITGCNKAMYANRISYWIDGKGPSYALDLACASSMACLEHAYRSISTGQCEAAIVGGCNLCMHPNVSLNLKRAGFLCLDGKTKCFDKNGDGYVRSDAISVLFLQKAKDAKRIYSEVYHAFGNYSLRADAEFLPLRQPKDMKEFLEAFYSSINVSPSEVEYIEASGSAIAEADGNELEAIGQVFAKTGPIKVGSVKSNMGHSEPASGTCSLTKVCLAYHKGVLPANLHYYDPQNHIPSVSGGKVQVLEDHTTFKRGYTALNSFSYSGANIHVLLKGHYKPKDPERYRTNIPHLVLISGRQESCVNKILDTLKNEPVDPEQISLLQNIHNFEIPGHMCRGYTILGTNNDKETKSLARSVEYCSGSTVPIWFVYSGMGSQWAGMGAALMAIPIFAAAIERCHKVLEPKGINLTHILTNPDKTIYDNILNSFVGIAAVQIGLTDVLKAMGIVPDNIIGHSVGELGCAYADGCFTAEEMILSAYSRGLVSVQTPFIRGSMAAVGLGYKAVLPLCPPEIEVACHNSSESATISGPADIMKKFVTELTKKGIFAKEVPCSNIAYHSKYIAAAGPGLRKYLGEVIKTPRARSEKWVSTSVPEQNWTDEKAKYSSAEYHTNNLLNPVLFEETSKLIPENALLIEIAPHGLLQAILKRSQAECINVPLTRRGHADPVQFLLEAIGKLYQAGLNPKVDVLYPKIEFPVSTETPLLSHLVEWEHSETWPEAKYNTKDRVTATSRQFVMSIHDDDYKNFVDYVRNGTYVFPESALLVLVWETFAMKKGVDYRYLSVVFKNVQFHGEAIIRTEVPLRLGIMIHKGNNMFEVSYENTQIVSGVIEQMFESCIEQREFEKVADDNADTVILESKDIYRIMNNRGFSYKNDFQSIQSSNSTRTKANLKWNNDWATFLDSVIQFTDFARDYSGISVPKLIKNLSIDTEQHHKLGQANADEVTSYSATLYNIYNVTRSGGVFMENIAFTDKPQRENSTDLLKIRTFVPNFLTGAVDVQNAIRMNLQVVADNIAQNNIKVTNFVNKATEVLAGAIKTISKEIFPKQFDINVIDADSSEFLSITAKFGAIKESNLLVVNNLLENKQKMKTVFDVLQKNSFVLTLEKNNPKIDSKNKMFHLITAMYVENQILILFKKGDDIDESVSYIPATHDTSFSWMDRVEAELEKSKRVVLLSERQRICGLLGYVKSVASKYQNKIGLVVIDDYNAPPFNPDNAIYKQQMLKNLTLNIFKQGQWGCYFELPCIQSAKLQNFRLCPGTPGDIESVTWNEAPPSSASSSSVQVYFAGLSFRDAQVAVGKVKGNPKGFGMDYSGIDNQGKKVMGVLPGDAVASNVKSDLDLLWPVPEHWSLEDAATVPLPYVHAYYCLIVKSNLRKGSSVFVSGGAGALGQAIISICLALDCTVYTVVSDIQKKRFLKRLFPNLDEKNIGCSRDESFKNMVALNSRDKRCDVVINCYSGALRKAAMKCAGFTGIFLDISDIDMTENGDFGMFYLFEEKTYKSVHLLNLFKPENSGERKMLQSLITEGIAKGIVKPLSRVVYEPEEVHRAFRLLSSSRHRGRVLISMRDQSNTKQGLEVKPVMTYTPSSTYVIVCDENCMGVDLADHLVRRGVKKLMIHIKHENVDGYFHTKLAFWKKSGATVALSFENLKTEKGCLQLLEAAAELGKINDIFIVQESDLHKNASGIELAENYNETALVVANLDMISRKVCTELSNFVVIANTPQNSVDAYTVAASDKICQARNDIGLPALAFHYHLSKAPLSATLRSLETSMKLKYCNVVTQKQTNSSPHFLKKISAVLGINKIDGVPQSLTLAQLSLNDVNIEEIRSIINEKYKINILPEKLMKMTVESLRNLEHSFKEHNVKFDAGLGAFYTFIDDDECMASEPMVAMPTKLSNATETEEELDPKATYLMLLPGFEGHHQIFKSISERLKIQAMAFQLGPDLMNHTIPDMAANVMKFMKKRFELKSKFYLLGYSFGVNVALELAALMEREGHVGIVYCLDSSPDALRTQLSSYIGNHTDTELQNLIVQHMYQLMTGKQCEELNKELNSIEKWTDKIAACVNKLRGQVNYSNQYKISVLEAAYRRILLARDYVPDFKLESKLVLVRGIAHPKSNNLDSDYGLSKYTKQPVLIYDIKADHASVPFDCRVSNIVNRMLDTKILDEFKQKNLCDTYLADPFKIL